MGVIPTEALPYFENMIYLPMLLLILEQDLEAFEKGPFKLKRPYVDIIERATKLVRTDLQGTSSYLRQNNIKVVCGKNDDTFTEYLFINGGYEDPRRYLNVRLRNRTEELLTVYFSRTEI